MRDLQGEDFQQTVAQFLMRHQSVLDILSKSQEANARMNRAVTKAVTSCGCLRVHAEKKPFPKEASLKDLKNLLDSHLQGELCSNCRDIVINEMGKNLFYLAALCNTLGITLNEVMEQEIKKITTLGVFNLT